MAKRKSRKKYQSPNELVSNNPQKVVKSINMTKETVEYLEEECKRTGASFSALVNEACREYVKWLKRRAGTY